jgi:Cu+-exporting ATPase
MKKYILIIFSALTLLVIGTPAFAKVDKQSVTFYVDLHCQGCIDKIYKNIAYEKGVKDLKCDLETKTVVVTYDAAKTDISTLQKAFASINKPASLTPVTDSEHDEQHHHDHRD